MKKRTIEDSIKRTTLLSSTIITFIVATIISIVLIKTEYSNFKSHIKNFRNTLIQREIFSVKTAVENLKNDIELEKISILNSKKQRIKNQSIIAYNLSYSLYKSSQNYSKDEKLELIKSSLREISQKQSDINYFILDTKGNLLLNTQNPKDEGVNFLGFEDINGVKFTNEIINANKNKQNYIEYYWYKPEKRITFSRHLKELDIVIGSASYLESSKDELKDKLLKKASLLNFKKDEFLFIYKINSLNNITTKSELLAQRNIQTSKKDLYNIKRLLIKSNYKGNEHIFYESYQKLIYGTYLENIRYFIALGTKLSHIDQIVKNEKEISLENMYNKIKKLLFIIFIMGLIFFIFSLMFTRKIESLFSQYRNKVKQNEEKYALLFNHSNDGFIISQIKNNKTSILSSNDTALYLTGFKEKELINSDFFDLFKNLSLDDLEKNTTLFTTEKLTSKDNQIKTIELNLILYTYENQKLIFASLRDISERTLLKQEKEKQENMLIQKSKMAAMGEMIGNIAHQWRQPLAQISGLFFDIESAYDYKELDKKYLSKRVDEANDLLEYMSKTIDDFRNFFNPTSKKESFLLIEAIDNALKIVNSTLNFHKINIEVKCNLDYKINGYKNEYSQVIVNIISNAKDILIDRKIKEPKIKIYLENENTLCIEDNAGGIDNSIIDKIFDPYFTTKYEYGTGIGLYMTKLIIEDKMNGEINATNIKDGAVFKIKI